MNKFEMRNRILNERYAMKRFISVMYEKLKLNRHKGNWFFYSRADALSFLIQEVAELAKELDSRARTSTPENCASIVKEAADVALFAMFIADTYGDLNADVNIIENIDEQFKEDIFELENNVTQEALPNESTDPQVNSGT